MSGIALALTLGCHGGSDIPSEGSFSGLSYNVHGLPSLITGDDTPARMAQIAPLLPEFDLMGLQEDFDETHHATLANAVPHPTKEWFNERIDTDRFYGSGLAVFSQAPAVLVHHEHYAECHGMLEGASDCLASKGFQAVRIQLGPDEDQTLDVYNSHLEAGGSDEDNAARATHVDQLLAAMSSISADRAVLFFGDTNLKDSDPADLPLITRFIEDASLTELCVAVDCPTPGRIDRILYRSSEALTLTGEDWWIAEGFEDDEGTPLSDHEPIAGQFSWSAP